MFYLHFYSMKIRMILLLFLLFLLLYTFLLLQYSTPTKHITEEEFASKKMKMAGKRQKKKEKTGEKERQKGHLGRLLLWKNKAREEVLWIRVESPIYVILGFFVVYFWFVFFLFVCCCFFLTR